MQFLQPGQNILLRFILQDLRREIYFLVFCLMSSVVVIWCCLVLLFTVVSVLPLFFPNATLILIVRFLQGLGLSIISVLGRAILSDLLPAERLVRVMALVATAWGIGPVIGPLIGGYLQYYFDWQACFYFFSIFGLVGFLLLLFVLPETHLNRHPFSWSMIMRDISEVIHHGGFIGCIIMMGLLYSTLVIFNILGPFVVQNQFHHTSIYFGHVALLLGFAFLCGTLCCRWWLKTHPPEHVLKWSLLLGVLISMVMVFWGWFAPTLLLAFLGLALGIFFVCGLSYPAAMGKGASLFRHIAGSASSVMTLVSLVITCMVSFAAGFLGGSHTLDIALYDIILLALSSVVWIVFLRRYQSS